MRPTVYSPAAKTWMRLAGALAHRGGRRELCALGLSLVLGMTAVVLGVQSGTQSQSAVRGIKTRTKAVIVGPEGEPFSMPSDAAVGRDCDLYVLDGVHHRVVVYDAEGKFRFKFGGRGSGAGQLLFPLGISTGPDGKVYVADSGNHRFQVFSADGKPFEAIQLPSTASGVPPDPTDVAVDPVRQRLYVTDNDNHRLHSYNLSSHSFEAVLGSPGTGRRQFRHPFLIDICPPGYVLVVEPINTRVQVFNSRGQFVGFIGGWGIKAGQLFRPKGVAVCSDQVFVTDSYLGTVQVYDLRGDFLGMLTDPNGAPMQLTTPTGIAADVKRRRLYVVELKANRVCRMDLE
ncbi:MAG: NHL repeat-containing protein [Phycisphaerales bacterium]|nr:MAG: NHL repeat-containing protein [Phycisphaerales bacterium]